MKRVTVKQRLREVVIWGTLIPYETVVNIPWFVTNGQYYPTFELGFLDDFEDLENVSEMVAETSETSKDQQSESATGENNMCMCTLPSFSPNYPCASQIG